MLAARAWWRYAVVNSAPPADLLRLRVLLLMLSLSMILWIFVIVLMGVGPRDQAPWGSPNLISVLRATHSRLIVSDKSVALYDGFCPFTSQALRHSTDAPIETKLGAGEWVSCRSLASLRNEYSSTHSTNIGSESVCPASPRLSPSTPTGL